MTCRLLAYILCGVHTRDGAGSVLGRVSLFGDVVLSWCMGSDVALRVVHVRAMVGSL